MPTRVNPGYNWSVNGTKARCRLVLVEMGRGEGEGTVRKGECRKPEGERRMVEEEWRRGGRETSITTQSYTDAHSRKTMILIPGNIYYAHTQSNEPLTHTIKHHQCWCIGWVKNDTQMKHNNFFWYLFSVFHPHYSSTCAVSVSKRIFFCKWKAKKLSVKNKITKV